MIKIDFLKKEKHFKKDDSKMNPSLYWKFTILGVFVLALVSFVFGYYLFDAINQEPVLTDNSHVLENKVKKERIDKVIGYFDDQAKNSSVILNSHLTIVDPSL